MYPVAIDAGVNTREFWDLTLFELYDRINSYRRTTKFNQKNSIDIAFTLADAIATRVIFFFEDPKDRKDDQILYPWDAYPELFEKEEKKVQVDKQKLEIEKHIATMRAFAAAYQHRKEQQDGDRA